MGTGAIRRLAGAAVLALALAGSGPARTAAPVEPALALRAAILLGCAQAALDAAAMAARLPGAVKAQEEPLALRDNSVGWRRRFALADGGALILQRLAPPGEAAEITAEYDSPAKGGPRPSLWAIGDQDCAIAGGRRLNYDAAGRAAAIEPLDAHLLPSGAVEPLKAKVPAGRDPGGIAVAQVDTGVNYLLPAIAVRLARDAAGKPLGYDYWTMDDQPFDANPAVSPFFAERHGTAVASVLLREAPKTRLIPYRYPRPAMARMAALVEDAVAKGARIMTVSLGSNRKSDWDSFAAAVAAHGELLVVVSAGNDGRDIDRVPVYPAALRLPNLITVTSADAAAGAPAAGANWGQRGVDLAVPGEDIEVVDFAGQAATLSGSSFAAPRVAALAARLLAGHPGWHAVELKSAIFARAVPVAGPHPVAVGFIRDPTKP